jgi:hypothetical protein
MLSFGPECTLGAAVDVDPDVDAPAAVLELSSLDPHAAISAQHATSPAMIAR